MAKKKVKVTTNTDESKAYFKEVDKKFKKDKKKALKSFEELKKEFPSKKIDETLVKNVIDNQYTPSEMIACLQKLTTFIEGISVKDLQDPNKQFLFPFKAFQYEYQKPNVENILYVVNKLLFDGKRTFEDLFDVIKREEAYYIMLKQFSQEESPSVFYFMMTKEELTLNDKSLFYMVMDNRLYQMKGIDNDSKITSTDFRYIAEMSYRKLKKVFEEEK